MSCRAQVTPHGGAELLHYGPSKSGSRINLGSNRYGRESRQRSTASARSQICFSDPKFRYRPRPRENCLLRIRWASSMPAKLMAAVPNEEASHGGASTFDRSMILLNQMVSPLARLLIASAPAMSTSVTPGQFGFILRRRSRLRRFVILPSDGSRGALIRIGCAARRRADRFIDRLSRLLISIFTPWPRASDIFAGRTFTVSHKSPQNCQLVMKLLCREDHNGGASRSGVGDCRSKRY
jgi:hypothetical protein